MRPEKTADHPPAERSRKKPTAMNKQQLGEFHKAAAIKKCREEIAVIFASGPITVMDLGKHFGYSNRASANVRMNSWKKMGLVRPTGAVKKIEAASGNGSYLRDNKLWEAVK